MPDTRALDDAVWDSERLFLSTPCSSLVVLPFVSAALSRCTFRVLINGFYMLPRGFPGQLQLRTGSTRRSSQKDPPSAPTRAR